MVITFWRTGFSIDDGPLRKFDDPANKPFLEDVHSCVPSLVLCCVVWCGVLFVLRVVH